MKTIKHFLYYLLCKKNILFIQYKLGTSLVEFKNKKYSKLILKYYKC